MQTILYFFIYHNINTYALGKYSADDPRVQYDTRNANAYVGVGDRFGYDYNILVDKANWWASYKYDRGRIHSFISGRIGGTQIARDGKMENGMAVGNSWGESGESPSSIKRISPLASASANAAMIRCSVPPT